MLGLAGPSLTAAFPTRSSAFLVAAMATAAMATATMAMAAMVTATLMASWVGIAASMTKDRRRGRKRRMDNKRHTDGEEYVRP